MQITSADIIAMIHAMPISVGWIGVGGLAVLIIAAIFRKGSSLPLPKALFTLIVAFSLCWCLVPMVFLMVASAIEIFGGSGAPSIEPHVVINILFFVVLFVINSLTGLVFMVLHNDIR